MGMNNVLTAIRANDTFLISTHKSPDGDALGSCIALGLALKQLGKQVTYAFEKPSSTKFSFLTELGALENADLERSFQVGLFLDASDPDHLYDAKLMEKCRVRVNVDHHVSNVGYGNINFVDVHASATAEIVYELIQQLGVELDNEMALAIYTGIVSDTGNFKYSNVTYKTHEIAGKLYKISNPYWEISKKLFDELSFDKVQIIGFALGKIQLIKNGKVALIHLTNNDLKQFTDDIDMEGIINYARDIIGVEVALLIKETSPQVFKLSMRSNTDFDVSVVAVHFDGGGHAKAAGCTVRDMSFQALMDQLDTLLTL
jgi:phosphoesterase RecJ-like protein